MHLKGISIGIYMPEIFRIGQELADLWKHENSQKKYLENSIILIFDFFYKFLC